MSAGKKEEGKKVEDRRKFFDHLFRLDLEGDEDDDDEVDPEMKRKTRLPQHEIQIERDGENQQTLGTKADRPVNIDEHHRRNTLPLEPRRDPGEVLQVGTLKRADTVPCVTGEVFSGSGGIEDVHGDALKSSLGNHSIPRSLQRSSAFHESIDKKELENNNINMPLKKKTTTKLQLVSESRQVFKGLTFHFVPNDAIGPRRRRIEKAQEYGATWSQKLDDSVTHIIVDATIVFKDVLRYLRVDAISQEIVLVNETYPAECIGYANLIDSSRSRFQVDGHEKMAKTTVPGPERAFGPEKEAVPEPTSHPQTPEVPESPMSDHSRSEAPQSPAVAGPSVGNGIRESTFTSNDTAERPKESGKEPVYIDDLSKIIRDVQKTGDIVSVALCSLEMF